MTFFDPRRLLRPMLALSLIVLTYAATPVVAEEKLVTADDIYSISPNAKDDLVAAILAAEDEFVAAGIDTRLRMAHFLAQVLTETGGLNRLDENMNYSYSSLMRVFSRRTVSEADARRIARKPREVANWVYGARLGNRGRHTDDGWNYRGSGFIQLTGRSNFLQRGEEIGLPLAENPEMARDPAVGLTAAIAYWTAVGINSAADANDRLRVRKLVNGPAAHGKEQARTYFNRAWTRVFEDKSLFGFESGENVTDIVEDETALFDDILAEQGHFSANENGFESGSDDARADAIKDFQRTWGLPESGTLDAATEEALLDPRLWRHAADGAEEEAALAPPSEVEAPALTSVSWDLTETTEPDEAVVTPAGYESGEALAWSAQSGSGALARHPMLGADDMAALKDATAIYAAYEMGAAAGGPDRFVPYSIIGDDDRVAVRDTTEFPARAMVQIRLADHRGKRRLCSGTLISADTVLTAAHCIHSGTISGQLSSDFRLVPARNGGSAPFGACNALKAFALSGWVEAESHSDARLYDLGAFKLDCEVGETTGHLAVRALGGASLGLATVVHGYASDKAPPGLQWISQDQIRAIAGLKGYYDNDTYGGSSGAAVYTPEADDTVIGVHTNGMHGKGLWASHNAFTRITEEMLPEIAAWIAE